MASKEFYFTEGSTVAEIIIITLNLKISSLFYGPPLLSIFHVSCCVLPKTAHKLLNQPTL